MPEALISPPGHWLYANLLKPKEKVNKDTGETKHQYGVVLQLDNPELSQVTKDFITSLHRIFVEKFGVNASYGPNGRPWKKETETLGDGTERETGLTRITFNRDVRTKGGADLPPPSVEDAAGQPWPANVMIGNGSFGRIAFSVYAWDNPAGGKGISLNLLGVRLLRHVPYVAESLAVGAFGPPEEGDRADSPAVLALAGGTATGASDVPWDFGPASQIVALDDDIPF
jgi:hypothetical protein